MADKIYTVTVASGNLYGGGTGNVFYLDGVKAALGVAALASKKGREKAKKIMKGKTKLSPAMNYLGRDMGGEIKGYGQARSKGMGLQDESVPMKDNSYIKDLI